MPHSNAALTPRHRLKVGTTQRRNGPSAPGSTTGQVHGRSLSSPEPCLTFAPVAEVFGPLGVFVDPVTELQDSRRVLTSPNRSATGMKARRQP